MRSEWEDVGGALLLCFIHSRFHLPPSTYCQMYVRAYNSSPLQKVCLSENSNCNVCQNRKHSVQLIPKSWNLYNKTAVIKILYEHLQGCLLHPFWQLCINPFCYIECIHLAKILMQYTPSPKIIGWIEIWLSYLNCSGTSLCCAQF